jgi:hypothetical protein
MNSPQIQLSKKEIAQDFDKKYLQKGKKIMKKHCEQ